MYKPGDFVLYRAKRDDWVGAIIGWFTGGSFCHASIVQFELFDGVQVVESQSPHGVSRNIIKIDPKQHKVYRYWAGTDKEKAGMVDYCEDQIGKPYDLLAFPGTWWRSTLRALGLSKYSKQVDPNNDRQAFYCSELLASAYRAVTGGELIYNLRAESVTPNDLQRQLARDPRWMEVD